MSTTALQMARKTASGGRCARLSTPGMMTVSAKRRTTVATELATSYVSWSRDRCHRCYGGGTGNPGTGSIFDRLPVVWPPQNRHSLISTNESLCVLPLAIRDTEGALVLAVIAAAVALCSR